MFFCLIPSFHSRAGGNLTVLTTKAGISRRRRWGGFPTPSSIPAKAGISAVRDDFADYRGSASRKEIPAFAGMEWGGMGGLGGIWGDSRHTLPFPPRSSIPAPFFHSRESGNLAGRHRPPRIATGDIVLPLRGISRESGKRFPLSREWNEGGMGGFGGMLHPPKSPKAILPPPASGGG